MLIGGGSGTTVSPATRDSNIELLRCIAMLMIIGLHLNKTSIQAPTAEDLQTDPLNACTRILFESLFIGAVNIFVFISGWFGIHPKLKSLGKLLFQTFFFTIGTYLFLLFAGFEPLSTKDVIKGLAHGLMLDGSCWFVKSYIGLFLLAPFCNSFLARATRRQIELFLVSFFAFEMVYGWVGLVAADFKVGSSTMSFLFLYMLARYVRIYHYQRIQTLRPARLWGGFALMVILTFVLFLPLPVMRVFNERAVVYSSPLAIGMALFLVPAFARYHFHCSVINKLAASAFSVYLIHTSGASFPHFLSLGRWLYSQYSGIVYLLAALGVMLGVFLLAFLTDQIRILCWNGVWRIIEPHIPKWIDEELKKLPR